MSKKEQKKEERNDIYCPACGQESEFDLLGIAPGACYSWKCPVCDTRWMIVLNYEEQDE